MRNTLLISAVALLLVLVPSLGRAAGWKVGAAKVVITPEKFMWMSGYGGRTKPAEGKLSELYAKALAIEDAAGRRLLLVTLDLVGIDRDFSLRVRDRIWEKHKLDRAAVALSVSHTHSGPVVGTNLRTMYAVPPEQDKLIDEYTAALEEKLVALAGDALGNLAPATVEWGVGRVGFAVNRRANPEAKVVELRAAGQLAGPVDHDLPVLAARAADGSVRAVVFGYACHATVLSGYDWSGDWPGVAQAELESAFPGAVALFVAGCGADQNPVPRRKVELAVEYARQAADGVRAALKAGAKRVDGAISAAYHEIEAPFADIPTREDWTALLSSKNKFEVGRAKTMLAKLDRGESIAKTYPYPVQVWKLGAGPTWVLLGGEVVVDYSLRLKKELGPGTWVSAYANDVMAYVPSRRVLAEGGYEGGGAMVYYGLPAPWAPGIEDAIVGEVRRLATAPPGPRAGAPGLPDADATVTVHVRDAEAADARPVPVYLRYPGRRIDNVRPTTGLMLDLHNWGGVSFEGAPDSRALADAYDVIAIGVGYYQSGDKDDPKDPVPYDLGYRQAMDALRALHFVRQGLRDAGRAFDATRVYGAGGSGGGTVIQMANKFAPRTFACVIDLSGTGSLTDDIAFGLPGGSRLNARYSRDPASPAYLSQGMQEIRDVGNAAHLTEMSRLGNRCKVVVVHGQDDEYCLAPDKRRVVEAMRGAGLDVDAHFLTRADVDGKLIRNSGHSVGDRTALLKHFAGAYLTPGSEKMCRVSGPSDFDRGGVVTYPTRGGRHVVSFAEGVPTLTFVPAAGE